MYSSLDTNHLLRPKNWIPVTDFGFQSSLHFVSDRPSTATLNKTVIKALNNKATIELLD